MRFRIFCDTSNENYQNMLPKDEWDRLRGLPEGKETCEDMLEFLLFFGILAPFLPGSLGFVGTDIIHHMHRDISDVAMRVATQAGGWRRTARVGMNSQDQENQALLRNLERGSLPAGLDA